MNIIKTNWNWRAGLSKRLTTKYIALHHAAALTCSAQTVDKWHKGNGWSGIGYHFFVRKDGSVYEGRPLWATGAHVEGSNNNSIGICAEGDYSREKTMPEVQKKAIKDLLTYLKDIYPSAVVKGHKDLGASGCPGDYYPLQEMKDFWNESEDIPMTPEERKKFNEMVKIVSDLSTPMIYNYIDENMPEWAREGVQFCVDKGIIQGTGEGLGLDNKDLKYCTIIMRLYKSLVV